MPSGRTHDGLTWGAAFPLAFGIGWYGDGWLPAAVFGASFLFGGLMFGPDLDLPSVQVRRWGPLKFIWRPYQRMFRHRSRWTHGILVGPLLRILYLLAWLALAGAAFGATAVALGFAAPRWGDVLEPALRALRDVDPAWLVYGALGLWGGAALHTLTDEIVSKTKRLLRFGKPRR